MGKSKELATLTDEGGTIDGTLTVNGGYTDLETQDTNNYARVTTVNGSAQLGLYRSGGTAGGFYIGGDADKFRVYDSSFTPRMEVDASGRVTLPYQPSFRAGSSSQIYNGNASTAYVVFPTVNHNIGSHYSSSTGRFTAPVDGVYHFSFSGNMVEYNGEVGSLYTELTVNAARKGIFYLSDSPDGQWHLMSWSLTLELSASDYVQVRQSDYSRLDSGSWTQFSGYLIG